MERQRPRGDGEPIDPGEARDLLETSDVAVLGRRADARRRRCHGDVATYGGEPDGDGVVDGGDGFVELDARDGEPPTVEDRPADVDAAALGTAPVERHERYHDAGVATDAAAVYGDGDYVATLEALRELARRTERLRCVAPVPAGDRSTAYDDLRAVAVARLYLDDDVHVRVRRDRVGGKCAQTALAFGADDVGFAGDGDHDPALVIEEAGLEPRRRGPGYHG